MNLARQVLVTPQRVLRIGRLRNGAAASPQEILFAHHPLHALAIDQQLLTAHLLGRPPGAVGRMVQGGLDNGLPQFPDMLPMNRRVPPVPNGKKEGDGLAAESDPSPKKVHAVGGACDPG